MVECERNIEDSSETVSLPMLSQTSAGSVTASPSQSLGMDTSTAQKRSRQDDDEDALCSLLEFEDQGNGQVVVTAAFMSSPTKSSQGNGSAAAISDPEAYFALQKKLKNETEKREIELEIATLKLACTTQRKLAAYDAVKYAKQERDVAVKDRDAAALAAALVRDAAALAAALVVDAAQSVLELATLRRDEVISILKQRVHLEKKLLTLNKAV